MDDIFETVQKTLGLSTLSIYLGFVGLCWIWIKISRYGEIASPALALLAENGETKKLEIDMKRSSDNIRSVIKARY